MPLAWLLARVEFPGRRLVRALVTVPLVLPPVVGGVALLLVFGRRGLVGSWLDATFGITLPFTTAGVVVAEAFVAMPFLVIAVEGALRGADTRYEEAAATLGAGRWTAFRRVTLPLVAPGVAAGAVLCWARALGEFGATITFAGNFPGRTQTMPLAVYLALETDLEAAIVLSLVLLAVSVAILAGAARPLDRPAHDRRPQRWTAASGTRASTPGSSSTGAPSGSTWRCTSRPARWSPCSAPTAPARPPPCAPWPACIPLTAGHITLAGRDLDRPDRGAGRRPSAARSAWSSRTTCSSRT